MKGVHFLILTVTFTRKKKKRKNKKVTPFLYTTKTPLGTVQKGGRSLRHQTKRPRWTGSVRRRVKDCRRDWLPLPRKRVYPGLSSVVLYKKMDTKLWSPLREDGNPSKQCDSSSFKKTPFFMSSLDTSYNLSLLV